MPSTPYVSNGDSERECRQIGPQASRYPTPEAGARLLPFPTPTWDEQTHQEIAPLTRGKHRAAGAQALDHTTILCTTCARSRSIRASNKRQGNASASVTWFQQEEQQQTVERSNSSYTPGRSTRDPERREGCAFSRNPSTGPD